MHDDPFPFEYQNPNCDPFAFGGIDWCGFTPDADELCWQERQCKEKLDEGSIAYFQEEEGEQLFLQKYYDSEKQTKEGNTTDSHTMKDTRSSSSRETVKKGSPEKPRLWVNNPSRPYDFGKNLQEVIDLTLSKDSDDDFFNDV